MKVTCEINDYSTTPAKPSTHHLKIFSLNLWVVFSSFYCLLWCAKDFELK